MSEWRKWKYYAATCCYKETRKAGLFSGNPEGHWVLLLDQEHSLSDGLNHMGNLGYELVGIQQEEIRYGGQIGGVYRPTYIYVFKQPLDT
jgi:hypothetical protein